MIITAFNGWAVAYTYYRYDYSRAETFAKVERRGIWQGQFVMPWDWRRGERLPQLYDEWEQD